MIVVLGACRHACGVTCSRRSLADFHKITSWYRLERRYQQFQSSVFWRGRKCESSLRKKCPKRSCVVFSCGNLSPPPRETTKDVSIRFIEVCEKLVFLFFTDYFYFIFRCPTTYFRCHHHQSQSVW